jgi:two-component system, OmpR family, sensor histidine kinase ArlS
MIYAAIFSLVLVLLNAAILLGVGYFLIHQAVAQVKNTGEDIIGNINESAVDSVDLGEKDLVQEIPSNDNIYVKIVDTQGIIINESAKFNAKIPGRIPLNTKPLALLQKYLLYENREIRVNGHRLGYLQVVKSLTNEKNFLQVLFYLMGLAEFLGIIISLISGSVISKKMLRPIADITTTAQSISFQDLNSRIEVNGPKDELTTLAQTFNEMIDRLRHSFEQQNQFVSNASHELRTPISVIQGYINLLDRWGKDDKAILEESISVIKNETANMAELIEKLLFLARSDQGEHYLAKDRFSFRDLVDEVLKETRVITTNHEILHEHNEEVSIYGDRKMLKQMLRAIIDNSIKFTPQGSITINSIKQGDQALVTVEDTGIGIPETEIPQIFNRFYQVDKARVKTQSGSGLGLAIVKWIVDVHQGSLLVESEVGKGTKISVCLPLN